MKSLWMLIKCTGLWQQDIKLKYIGTFICRRLDEREIFNKPIANASIMWTALVLAFHLVVNWLAWKIGNGRSVVVGANPWIGDDGHLSCQMVWLEPLGSEGYSH